MINAKILHELCEAFILGAPNYRPELPIEVQLQNNILDINLPRQCGKTRVAARLALEYADVIIVPANRHMARHGYSGISKEQLYSHIKLKEREVGTKYCSLENKIIILDESLPLISPEEILRNYLRYPHGSNRTVGDLVWQAPKIIALGTRYRL